MSLPLFDPPERHVLWQAPSFGRQRVPSGRPYWWTNRPRRPEGTVVVQVTLEGEAVLEDEAGAHVAPAGAVMLFVYGEPTAYGRPNVHGPAYACQWVHLRGAGLIEHIGALRRRHGPVLQLAGADRLVVEMDELTARVDPASTRHSDDPVVIAEAVHGFVMRLFELSQQSLRQAARPVDWAVEQMMRQATRPWSLKQFADHYGVSREHLSRVFRARTGQTPHAWLAAARLRHALRLLRDADVPLRQVAAQAGYGSAHHLARCIRTATGSAPTALRRR